MNTQEAISFYENTMATVIDLRRNGDISKEDYNRLLDEAWAYMVSRADDVEALLDIINNT